MWSVYLSSPAKRVTKSTRVQHFSLDSILSLLHVIGKIMLFARLDLTLFDSALGLWPASTCATIWDIVY